MTDTVSLRSSQTAEEGLNQMQKAPRSLPLKRQMTDPPFTWALHINRAAPEMNIPSLLTLVTSLRASVEQCGWLQTGWLFGREADGVKPRTSYLLLAAVEMKWKSSQRGGRIKPLLMHRKFKPHHVCNHVVLETFDSESVNYLCHFHHCRRALLALLAPSKCTLYACLCAWRGTGLTSTKLVTWWVLKTRQCAWPHF